MVTTGDRPQNGPLKPALEKACRQGRMQELENLLARHSGLPGPKPNLRFAQRFADEVLARVAAGAGPGEGETLIPRDVGEVLRRLAQDDAAPDQPQAFFAVAAAYGYVALIRAGRCDDRGWSMLGWLCADERAPVRVGILAALSELAARAGHADALLARAVSWLDVPDREVCFGAAALVVEVLTDTRVLRGIREQDALLDYLSQLLDKISRAARAAERSPGRRRALTSLSHALPQVVSALRAGDRGTAWFERQCELASHPDVRKLLSDTVVQLGTGERALQRSAAEPLRRTLEKSAKPLRDPTLVRPGTGRGRNSRRTR